MSALSPRWNRLRYRLYGPVYDHLARPLEGGRRRAVQSLDLSAGDRLLLVGCGTGTDLNYVPDGVEVVAVDVTPSMVRRTERRAARTGHDATVREMDARDLTFDDDSFDAATLHLLLSVVPDPAAVVREVDRVLTDEGRASVYDKFVPPGERVSLVRRAVNPLTRALFSDVTRSLDPLLADADLTVVRRESVLAGLYTVALLTRPDGASPDAPVDAR